jgi:hypothetical protein
MLSRCAVEQFQKKTLQFYEHQLSRLCIMCKNESAQQGSVNQMRAAL